MFRIRNNSKRWRLKWPWRVLFPLRLDQRNCRECGLPYHEGPLPKPVADYQHESVAALVFPSGSWRRKDYSVHFGRWVGKGNSLFLNDFIPEDELDSLITVATLARDAYRARTSDRRARR